LGTDIISRAVQFLMACTIIGIAMAATAWAQTDLQLPNASVPGPNLPSGTYSANTITAAGTNGALVISGGVTVTFIAQSQIRLGPGFTATASGANTGTTFRAVIGPPPPTTSTKTEYIYLNARAIAIEK
jgi:hypothetical protein